MSGGTAPTTVFTPPESGGSPADPSPIYTPPTLGGSTTAPPTVQAAWSEPEPDEPTGIFTPPDLETEPDAPTGIFVPALPEAVGSFTYQDYEFGDRDGTYVNLGGIAEGAVVFAKAGDTIAITAGVLSGGGMMFIQRWVGDAYSWTLESSADFATLSPSTLISQEEPSANREEYPTPADVPAWIGDGFDGNEFAWLGATAPSAVFAGASTPTPSAPPTILTPPSSELVPGARPTVVYRPSTLSADAELDSDGTPILDSDGYEVRDSTG
jgi:hypothetical protein